MFKEGEIFMQGLLKINLNFSLKRLISTLICLMMVLATFPVHMLYGSVWATDPNISPDKTIQLKNDTIGQVATWMSDIGPLDGKVFRDDENPVNIILINVAEDIDVTSPDDTFGNGRANSLADILAKLPAKPSSEKLTDILQYLPESVSGQILDNIRTSICSSIIPQPPTNIFQNLSSPLTAEKLSDPLGTLTANDTTMCLANSLGGDLKSVLVDNLKGNITDESLQPEFTSELLSRLSLENQAKLLTQFTNESLAELLKTLPDESLAKLLNTLSADSLVQLLSNNFCNPEIAAPTMTTGSDGNRYLFDFTDKRFKDKTIIIDGSKRNKQGKIIEGCNKITIDNADLFFLNMQNCKVILKNIVIDGKDNSEIKRNDAFINVGLASELETRQATIQDCCNGAESGYGGAINNRGNLKFLQESKINNCTCGVAKSCGGAVYNTGILIMDEKCEINDCGCVQSGGAIYNLNQVIIAGESSINGNSGESESKNAHLGGAIYNASVGVVTIDSCSIKNCFANDFGGAIYNDSTAALTINKCDIADCHVAASDANEERADAIYNKGVLTLPFNELGLFSVTLPEGHDNCGHNSDSNEIYGYKGIYNDNGIVRSNPSYKIKFIDKDTEEILGQGMFTKYSDVCVPKRAGYKFISWVDEDPKTTPVTDDKFKLTDDIIQNAKTDGMITLTATYKKIYTIQYIYENKVVATKKDCIRDETAINTIMSDKLSNITVDGDKNLSSKVELKLGYEFSKLTYGEALEYVAGGEAVTDWENLIKVAIGDVIPIFLNHKPKEYAIKYDVPDVKDASIPDQKVKFGEDIKAVTPPKKLGYDFKCWHVLDSGGTELKENGKPIDLETAKASWETLANAADGSNIIKLKAV